MKPSKLYFILAMIILVFLIINSSDISLNCAFWALIILSDINEIKELEEKK